MTIDRQTRLSVAALHAAIGLGATLENDIKINQGPAAVIMAWTWREAKSALAAMIDADATDVAEMKRLQGEVHKFLDLREFVAGVFAKANDASVQLELDAETFGEIQTLLRPQNEPHDQ